MSLLRALLFDNLGLKLVALLLAVLVYLNVYTDRPATMLVTFPLQISDIPDSLSLHGPAPGAVQAELRGTAKQLIRLRVTEPPVRVSLAGVGVGRYERALGVQDLPLPQGVEIQVDRFVTPRVLELQVDRKASRLVPVALRVEGEPASGVLWDGSFQLHPGHVRVTGPVAALEALDSVRVGPMSVEGRRDTLVASLAPRELPDWCGSDPERVQVVVPLEPSVTRRVPVELEPPRGVTGVSVAPARVTAVVTAPRRRAGEPPWQVRATWSPAGSLQRHAGLKVAVRSRGPIPRGVEVRFEPDSVTVQRAGS